MEKYEYRYPHPAVTADSVVFGYDGEGLNVLLIERRHDPCKGRWAFPGGFMEIDETPEACAMRELQEETGLKVPNMKQVGAYGAVERDPRERIVTVAYYALVRKAEVAGADDAARAQWWPIDAVPPLAFDHSEILHDALSCLKKDLYFGALGCGTVGEGYDKGERQLPYEAILGASIDGAFSCHAYKQGKDD